MRRGFHRLAIMLATIAASSGCGDDRAPATPTTPTPPVQAELSISCPANVATATAAASTQVTYPAPVASGGLAPVTVSCTPPSGAQYPLGTTTVTCTATDGLSRQAVCSFTVSVSRLPTLQRTRFLAFGDRVTAGEITVPTTTALDEAGPPSFKLVVVPSASYPTQLQTLLRNRYVTQAAAIEVTNAGRPGEAATDAVHRFSQVLANLRPEVVLLLDGYNDLNVLGASAIPSAAAAVGTMATEARQRGSRVFIASLTPPRAGGVNTIPAGTIMAFNDRLRSIAAGENAVFVDLYGALIDSVTLYVGVDGLHLTEAGYRRVAETFFSAIQRTLENP